MRCWSLVVVLLGLVATTAGADLPQPSAKKIISWRVPSLEFIRAHPEQVDQSPLDGVMVPVDTEVAGRVVSLTNAVFANQALNYEDFAPMLDTIRSTDWRCLTDNFLLVNVLSSDIDWFGDCSATMHNAAVAARFAREAGFKGIALDGEPYSWKHGTMAHPERPFDEYYKQIRLRSEEFADALWGEWPELRVLLLFGYYVGDRAEPAKQHYGLYPAFLDGLFAGAPDDAEITDGWEMSYTYLTREELLRAYWWVRQGALALCRVPEAYTRKVRVGFGIWPDPNQVEDLPYAWGDPEDFSNNYRTPEQLRSVMRAALETTDEYVWLFSGLTDRWCARTDVPDAYFDAMWEAKRTLRGLSSEHLEAWAAWPLTEEFAQEHELIATLPEEWRLRLDLSGAERTWHFPDADDSQWLTVKSNGEWCQQLPFQETTGAAWARVRFDIPAEYQGRPLFLWFGACDEEGDIYLNGKYVYTWTNDTDRGWQTPFPVEVTEQALPGQTNVLAVRVRATGSLGGIFRPVYLYTDR